MTSYYGMRADLANDIERVLKRNMGRVIEYDALKQEVLKKYGFNEKTLKNMLDPYKKNDQFFFDVVEGKQVLDISPDWKMGENKSLFEGL